MNSEFDTVNEIIAEEIEAAANAAAPTEEEILERARAKYHDERTLEDWRVMFFAEQRDRVHYEMELRRVTRRWEGISLQAHVANNRLSSARRYTGHIIAMLKGIEDTAREDRPVTTFLARLISGMVAELDMRFHEVTTQDAAPDSDIPF